MIPPCHNRPPRVPARTRYGVDSATGEMVATLVRDDWCPDRCATWDGVAIGPRTAAYPAGEPYPVAMGWDCTGCRWLPENQRGRTLLQGPMPGDRL